ncbi:MAG TPA: hypothetical protein VND93_14265 [Myxococcales bacterium]|nr:hypothetical protein [Myxococcales bacterium]
MIEVIRTNWISRRNRETRTDGERDSHGPAGASGERRLALGALAAALAAGLLARLWLAFTDDGIYWPDEIYQSLEPAHRLVFGYGLVPWEFIQGARSWAFPGALAAVLKLCAVLGLDLPRAYLGVVRALFCASAAATGYGVQRLARVLGASPLGAAAGAATFLLGGVPIYFAHRAMSETASAAPLVFGLAWVLERDRPRWRVLAGASLLGVAVLFRLQNAAFAAGALALLAARRDRPALGAAAAALGAWAAFYGLLDLATWGSLFHSAVEYLRFNLLEGKAAQWGTAGPGYYPRVLWTSMPAVTLCLAALVAASARRAPGLSLVALAFFLLHTLVGHKELRFIFPLLPVLGALAGVGFDALPAAVPRRGALAAVLGCSLFSAARVPSLTFGDLGQYEHERPGASALDDFGAVNRLLLAAGRLQDLCAIKVEAVHLAWTGGATYLHREARIYPSFGPPRQAGLFNYALSVQGAQGPGTEVVAREGPYVLLRLPVSGCRPDPLYQWRLP